MWESAEDPIRQPLSSKELPISGFKIWDSAEDPSRQPRSPKELPISGFKIWDSAEDPINSTGIINAYRLPACYRLPQGLPLTARLAGCRKGNYKHVCTKRSST